MTNEHIPKDIHEAYEIMDTWFRVYGQPVTFGMAEWLDDNTVSRWANNVGVEGTLWFHKEEDCMLFKLTWI